MENLNLNVPSRGGFIEKWQNFIQRRQDRRVVNILAESLALVFEEKQIVQPDTATKTARKLGKIATTH